MRSTIFAIALGVWLSSAAGVATAVPITWEFEAVVRSTRTQNIVDNNTFFWGQMVRGSLTFESSTPDSSPLDRLGYYFDSVTNIDLYVNYLHPVWVDVGITAAPADSLIYMQVPYSSYILASGLQPDSPYPSTRATTMRLTLQSSDPGFMPTDALPLIPPPLSSLGAFDPNGTSVSSTGLFLEGPGVFVGAELTMIRAVPEPAGSALALGGLLSLVFARALRSSSVRH